MKKIQQICNIQTQTFNNSSITINNNEVFDSSKGTWVSRVEETINNNTEYKFYNINIPFHYDDPEPNGTYFQSYHSFEYNYYSKNFEDFLARNNINEGLQLPDFYKISAQSTSLNIEQIKKLYEDLSFMGYTGDIISYIQEDADYEIVSGIPFYCGIQFDSHGIKKDGLIDTLKKINQYDAFFENLFGRPGMSLVRENVTNTDEKTKVMRIKNIEFLFNDFKDDESFKTFIVKNRYSLHEIKENLPSYNEVIGYKLLKYKNKKNDSRHSEEIYFYHKNDVINYIDSKIKYGNIYNYEIYSYVFCIQSSMQITTSKEVHNNPEINIYEVLTSTFNKQILLHPPYEPLVELIPYFKNKDHPVSIKFNFSKSSGVKSQIPVKINNSEDWGDQPDSTQRIIFSSMDEIQKIELWKLEKKPRLYIDFSEGSKIDLSLVDNRVMYTSISYLDSMIHTNKKYYYTYRCISVHGHYSNPGYIYEVEFLEDKGNIFPIITLYNIDSYNEEYEMKSLPIKKSFLIEPAFKHITPNPNSTITNYNRANQTFQGLILGASGIDSLWKKNLKFRLTSRSTGKKIDINVLFDYKQGL